MEYLEEEQADYIPLLSELTTDFGDEPDDNQSKLDKVYIPMLILSEVIQLSGTGRSLRITNDIASCYIGQKRNPGIRQTTNLIVHGNWPRTNPQKPKTFKTKR